MSLSATTLHLLCIVVARANMRHHALVRRGGRHIVDPSPKISGSWLVGMAGAMIFMHRLTGGGVGSTGF